MNRESAIATLMLFGWQMALYDRQPVVVHVAEQLAMNLGTMGMGGPRTVFCWHYGEAYTKRRLQVLEHWQTFSVDDLVFLAHAAASYLPAGSQMECRRELLAR